NNNITVPENDNQTKRRAKTPTPVNNNNVIALTRRKTKVPTLVNNILITQPTISKSNSTNRQLYQKATTYQRHKETTINGSTNNNTRKKNY
ncbi:33831_t:CDS:1, partial [Gigaspora margarita]